MVVVHASLIMVVTWLERTQWCLGVPVGYRLPPDVKLAWASHIGSLGNDCETL